MSAALDILDDIDAPGEIGSHLDLAMARLHVVLKPDGEGGTPVQNLLDQLEQELAVPYEDPSSSPSPWEVVPH